MSTLLLKFSIIMITVTGLAVAPAHAQQAKLQDRGQPLIKQGRFLTGFSLSLINASREDFNQEFEREFTDISVQVDGLYFINNRIGVGPLLGYRFTYRDLEDPFRAEDRDTRRSAFEYGAKGGWYVPAAKLFGGTGNSYFFVDGGISWLRTQYKVEPENNATIRNQFGFQLGTGFLLPVGKRIGIETKLGFQSRQQEYTFSRREPDGEIRTRTETKWLKEVALSVGLKVGF